MCRKKTPTLKPKDLELLALTLIRQCLELGKHNFNVSSDSAEKKLLQIFNYCSQKNLP